MSRRGQKVFILDIGDENITYVFASKGIPTMY